MVQARHARVELLPLTMGVAPHQQLWLGVHFSLEPGWHIYWINPGDKRIAPKPAHSPQQAKSQKKK